MRLSRQSKRIVEVLLACGVVFLPRGAAVSVIAGVLPAGIQIPGASSNGGVEESTKALPGAVVSSNALSAAVAEVQASLAAAVIRARASESNAPSGMPAEETVLRRTLLLRLVRIYEQQLSNFAELETAKKNRLEMVRRARDWSGFVEPRPYSVVLIDDLRETTQAEKLRIQGDERALSDLDRLITENRDELAHAEGKIRLLNEQLEGGTRPASISVWVWQRELEQIRSQVALAAVALLQLERQIRQENMATSRAHVDLVQRQLVVAQADARFTQADLDKVLAALEIDRRQLELELVDAEVRHSAALAALEAVQKPPLTADPTSVTNALTSTQAAELLNLRTAQWDGAVTAVRVLRLRLEATSIERTLWELRFAAYGSREVETLRQSERRLQTLSKRASLWKDYFRQKLETVAGQVALEEGRLSQLDKDSPVFGLVQERLAALRGRDQWLLGMFRCSQRLERLLVRWHEDLQVDLGNLPFGGRVRNLFSDARMFLVNLWRFEIFAAEDTITIDGQKISGKRSVTVGKIAGAVLILAVGYWVTGLVSRTGSRFLQDWLKVEKNQGELIRRWMRAFLLVVLLLFSLVSVKIPLTVFAFAGGALAIGVGFGTQTVLKNVVSGLIILFERPFGVGDVLDVGGQKGTLTSIGLRASVLQLWDGTETLFPNSTLLENALTNWTYSNRVVRFTILVGVAYGSDTRRVVQLLEDVVGRHGLVETQLKPQVFFTDFGPSALSFELRFWLDVIKTNPAQVSSDLRHMIAGTFAEAGIVIAFPQRDLHLQTSRPLQVEVLPGVPPALSSNGGETPSEKPRIQP